jgi:iron complex outermembrane receptor protein
MKSGKAKTGFLAGILALLLIAVPTMAEQKEANPMNVSQKFNIESGSLEDALNNYSKVTGIKTVYLNDLVTGKKSPGVQGIYSPEAAVKKMLKGTGLTYQVTAENTVVLKENKMVVAQRDAEEKEGAKRPVEIEEMVVTAQKREENIQEVSVSITALSATQIEDSGIVNMDDVAFQIPNFHLVDRGDRIASYPYVRGIGEFNPLNPVVALYVDDVCHAASSAVFDLTLHDIERIEVLRGPQGTLYGRNSLGGVINIITKKPENYFEGSTSVTYGNYDRWDIRAALRGPIVKDKLFLGIAADKNERDGYLDNTYLGTEPDEEDGLTGRAHLLWTPTDALDVTLSGNFERNHDNGCLFTDLERVRKDPHHISPDFDGFSDSDTNNQSLRVAYEVPWFKVISITGRTYWKNDYCGDYDFSPADMMRCGQIMEETE